MPFQVSERTRKIWERYNNGATYVEMCAEFGSGQSTIASAIYRGRQIGEIPPSRPAHPLTVGVSTYMPRGSIGRVLTSLTRDQLDWVADNAREVGCHTLSEYVLEIVRDAYEEDMAKKGRAGR